MLESVVLSCATLCCAELRCDLGDAQPAYCLCHYQTQQTKRLLMHLGRVVIYLGVHSDNAKHSVYMCWRKYGLVPTQHFNRP